MGVPAGPLEGPPARQRDLLAEKLPRAVPGTSSAGRYSALGPVERGRVAGTGLRARGPARNDAASNSPEIRGIRPVSTETVARSGGRTFHF